MIKAIEVEDAHKLSSYLTLNKENFQPWEPIRERKYYSPDGCLERISSTLQSSASVFFVYMQNEEIKAHCELSQIVHGPFQACYMGYGVSKKSEGKGIAYELCSFAIEYAFSNLILHRVMANYMPSNHRSERLLQRLGFIKEGEASKYLKIAGKWEDHILTSLINPN